MSANDRTGVGGGSGEWGTPPDLFKRLDYRFQFDYDPFASHANALCSRYSTVDGTYDRLGTANVVMDDGHDGLTADWGHARVFMNPPFSRGLMEPCIEKAFNERNNAQVIVALVPASTETRWFQNFILPHCHIDWLPRRVNFIHPPTRCVDRTGKECTHELNAAIKDPPAGMVIATFKTELMP
jgi:phage N-6-adenine-methyltransferase